MSEMSLAEFALIACIVEALQSMVPALGDEKFDSNNATHCTVAEATERFNHLAQQRKERGPT